MKMTNYKFTWWHIAVWKVKWKVSDKVQNSPIRPLFWNPLNNCFIYEFICGNCLIFQHTDRLFIRCAYKSNLDLFCSLFFYSIWNKKYTIYTIPNIRFVRWSVREGQSTDFCRQVRYIILGFTCHPFHSDISYRDSN